MPLIASSSSFCSITSQRASFGLCFSSSIISTLKNSGGSGSSSVRVSKRNNAASHGGSVSFASTKAHSRPIVDVVFEPFEEVKKELLLVSTYPHDSLARQKYTDQCEKAINDQIKWVSQSLESWDFVHFSLQQMNTGQTAFFHSFFWVLNLHIPICVWYFVSVIILFDFRFFNP